MPQAKNSSIAETRFASIITKAPIPFAILRGPEHIFEFVNDRYADLLGARKVLGRPVRDAFPDLNGQGYFEILDEVFKSGIAYEAKEALVKMDPTLTGGTRRESYRDFTYQPYHDPDGKIEGILIIVDEVTERVLAKKEVQKERARLESLFMQAPVAICVLEGPLHRFTLLNEPYAEIISRDQSVIGLPIREALPELEGQGIYELLDSVYETGTTFEGNEIFVQVKKSGKLRDYYFNFFYQPTFDENNKPSGVMAIVTDITAQVVAKKLTQESEKSFRQLADSMPQIVWTAGVDGVLNYTNQRWTHYSGSNVPADWVSFVHPEDLERVIPLWVHSVQTGIDYNAEFRLRNIKGNYRWHLVRAICVRDDSGAINLWYGTCTDIEERMQIQNDLETTKVQLQDAKNQAETANQLKTAFLANMSHEIRTPLGAILGFTEILKNRSSDSRERNQYLDVISRNGKSLTRIIDDILDLSKVEAGRLEVEAVRFSFKTLLDEVLTLFSDSVSEKKIKLQVELADNVPAVLISDPTRLRQILINIVGNAVKFTQQGEVILKVHAQQDSQSSRVFIEVSDTGVGLSEEQAKRLFEPFTQADNSTTRKYGGTGLGLALSKRLAKALNGDVTLEKYGPGKGCTFLIMIETELESPAYRPLADAEVKMPKNDRSITGLSILVVDDSPDNLDLIEIFMSEKGVKIDRAENGEEAVEKAIKNAYDIILMDIQMPGIDGHEAIRTLRRRSYSKPVIALTAHATLEERELAMKSGFNDHVSKPINFGTLIDTILKHT